MSLVRRRLPGSQELLPAVRDRGRRLAAHVPGVQGPEPSGRPSSRTAGRIVGAATAQRFGWKIGDRVPLQGTIFPGPGSSTSAAIYRGSRNGRRRRSSGPAQGVPGREGARLLEGASWDGTWSACGPGAAAQVAEGDRRRPSRTRRGRRARRPSGRSRRVHPADGEHRVLVLIGAASCSSRSSSSPATRWRSRCGSARASSPSSRPWASPTASPSSWFSRSRSSSRDWVAVSACAGQRRHLERGPDGRLPASLLHHPGWTGARCRPGSLGGSLAGAIPALSAMRLRVVDGLRRV